MAELIPKQYLLRVATRRRVQRWTVWGIVAVIVCVASLVTAFSVRARAKARLDGLDAEYRSRASLIVQSQDLRAKLLDLADRMQKIQHLQDDHVLVSLLRDVTTSFTPTDRLEYIHIDSANRAASADGKTDPATPLARVTGITTDSSTLAGLMRRLTAKDGKPILNVQLEQSHRDHYLDGQVMRFQLQCGRDATPNG